MVSTVTLFMDALCAEMEARYPAVRSHRGPGLIQFRPVVRQVDDRFVNVSFHQIISVACGQCHRDRPATMRHAWLAAYDDPEWVAKLQQLIVDHVLRGVPW
jgi:hypothetical protein